MGELIRSNKELSKILLDILGDLTNPLGDM
ncbi:hypothetical protein C7972_12920 [Arenibacter sp. ARW7G5Y1]|nr:hypothetical protein C7972_12920 [Arenibacter sp. ARW7G5Y1]